MNQDHSCKVLAAANKLIKIKTHDGGYQWWTWIAERAEDGEEECKALMELYETTENDCNVVMKLRDENADLKDDILRIAVVAGIYYEADGHNLAAGLVDAIVNVIKQLKLDQTRPVPSGF